MDKFDYMIASLTLAREELKRDEKSKNSNPEDFGSYNEYLNSLQCTNKTFVKENLRNVARIAFRLAREI